MLFKGDKIKFIGSDDREMRTQFYAEEYGIDPLFIEHGDLNFFEGNKGIVVGTVKIKGDGEDEKDREFVIVKFKTDKNSWTQMGFDEEDLELIIKEPDLKEYTVSYVNEEGKTVKTKISGKNESNALRQIKDAKSINYVIG